MSSKLFIRDKTTAALLLCCLSILCLYGCGYHLIGPSPLKNGLTIGDIKNSTREPLLEERLGAALIDELSKEGVKDINNGGPLITADIKAFSMSAVSEANELAGEYAITLKVDFRVKKDNRVIKIDSVEPPFLITFQASDVIQQTASLKDEAVRKAMREIVREFLMRLRLELQKLP